MSTNPFSEHPANPDPQQPYWTAPQQYADRIGFGPRTVAWIIDALFVVLVNTLLSVLLMNVDIGTSEAMRESLHSIVTLYRTLGLGQEVIDLVTRLLPAVVVGGAVGSLAYSLIEGLTGASPGKRITKLVIRRADGTPGSLQVYLSRWAVKYVYSIINFATMAPALAMVDFVGMLLGVVIFFGCFLVLGERRQALHDLIAQTAVYSTVPGT